MCGRRASFGYSVASVLLLTSWGMSGARSQDVKDAATSQRDCDARQGALKTPPATGEHSGSKNMGSTGWSGGGLGGSHTMTTPNGPSSHSATVHPPTVQGLSPKKGDTVASPPAC